MSDVLTAHELYGQMVAKSAQIDQALAEYRQQALNYANTKHASELAQAIAFPKTKGTVDERKHAILNICSDVYLTELQAEALRNGADKALKARMAQLSALQSTASALREEIRMARQDNFSP
jgi:hypothetical protein